VANVAAGLAYLHGETILHDDVKASNVCVGTSRPIIGGTPAFMAPEVARGEEQGPATNVWALGCTVVEKATDRAPWSGMDGDVLAAMHCISSNGWRARAVRGRRRATEHVRAAARRRHGGRGRAGEATA
jgi:serine/threonine protein kinase